jgi:predicted transcriptional regulator
MNDVLGYSFLATLGSGFSMILQTRTRKNVSIEDVLCSKTTMKILKALRMGQRLNTSEITRMIRSNFADTASHLKLLEEQEILAHSNFGVRSRIYRFSESPRAKAVKELLEAWE